MSCIDAGALIGGMVVGAALGAVILVLIALLGRRRK